MVACRPNYRFLVIWLQSSLYNIENLSVPTQGLSAEDEWTSQGPRSVIKGKSEKTSFQVFDNYHGRISAQEYIQLNFLSQKKKSLLNLSLCWIFSYCRADFISPKSCQDSQQYIPLSTNEYSSPQCKVYVTNNCDVQELRMCSCALQEHYYQLVTRESQNVHSLCIINLLNKTL